MPYVPKYSAVIIVNGDGTITVRQYANSTQAQLAYEAAQAAGKTCYYYYRPFKRRTLSTLPVEPISFTIPR